LGGQNRDEGAAVGGFSTIGPVEAGWLVKDSGRWSVTDEGRTAYERFTDPAEFMVEAARLYRVWKRQQPAEDESQDEVDADAGDDSAIAIEETEEAASSAIREYLNSMPPYDFQNLVRAFKACPGVRQLCASERQIPAVSGGFERVDQVRLLRRRNPPAGAVSA
jgi:hypothetical protein